MAEIKEAIVRLLRGVVLFAAGVLVPVSAFAQAAIAGLVRDSSGAVLPGVTVEAASPSLIEKTRAGAYADLTAQVKYLGDTHQQLRG